MRSLIAPTDEAIVKLRTRLTADAGPGAAVTVLPLDAGVIADGDIGCFGIRGSAGCEQARLSVSGGTVTATLRMRHVEGEPLDVLAYGSRRFYGATSEAGTYSLLATLPIDVADPQGTPYEYTGSLAWFKATYFNDELSQETPIADAKAVQGDQSARYCTIDRIRTRAGMSRNAFVQDDRFADARTNAESEIDSTLAGRYLLPMDTVPATITDTCELLAAGSVMVDEYGASELGKDGEKKQERARKTLEDIREGRIELVGADKVPLAKADGDKPSFYPNATSAVSTTDPTAPRMPRNKIY